MIVEDWGYASDDPSLIRRRRNFCGLRIGLFRRKNKNHSLISIDPIILHEKKSQPIPTTLMKRDDNTMFYGITEVNKKSNNRFIKLNRKYSMTIAYKASEDKLQKQNIEREETFCSVADLEDLPIDGNNCQYWVHEQNIENPPNSIFKRKKEKKSKWFNLGKLCRKGEKRNSSENNQTRLSVYYINQAVISNYDDKIFVRPNENTKRNLQESLEQSNIKEIENDSTWTITQRGRT